MSSWGDSSSSIPKIGSSKRIINLSRSKPQQQQLQQNGEKQMSIVNSLSISDSDSNGEKVKLEEMPQVEGKGKGRMEEPLYILEKIKKEKEEQQQLQDVEMDEVGEDDDVDDSFWKSAAELVVKKEKDSDMDDFVDNERFESLSVCDDEKTAPEPPKPTNTLKRKRVGEDVFTRESVKQWQGSRIKAWESRYLSPEGFYYRFVAPCEGQQNGGWSNHEHKLFTNRYKEWMDKGYKIGSAWGLFSCGIPHRVGYQCMNYYRKLVADGTLQDESYITIDGKLKQVHKERLKGTVPNTELGPEWKDEEVKEEEKNVDMWLKEFHGRSGTTATSRPIAPPKPKAAPRVVNTTSRRSNISDLVKKMPRKEYIPGGDDDFLGEIGDAEVAHLEARDWEKEWLERLESYKKFLEPYHDKYMRDQYWFAKQQWRQSLITTEMLLQMNVVRKTAQPPPSAASSSATDSSSSKVQQSSLSRFFTGVKKRKVDTPDEFISHVRIPNDLYSGVKRIQPLHCKPKPDDTKLTYAELEHMDDCIPILDNLIKIEEEETRQSPLEGILVDPPWEFYVADGRNDGSCTWNLSDFQKLMEKVLSHMTAGMIFVWVHKLIQADVVRMMYSIDCRYVENLVWFKKSVNNVQLDEPSPYFSSTKEILLMFKKGEGFELRHQRSPDVIIDFAIPKEQWIHDEYTEPKPPGVYDMIETLLPKAAYDESIGRGRFLELWAKKNAPRREGWIAFHENKKKFITNKHDNMIE